LSVPDAWNVVFGDVVELVELLSSIANEKGQESEIGYLDLNHVVFGKKQGSIRWG